MKHPRSKEVPGRQYITRKVLRQGLFVKTGRQYIVEARIAFMKRYFPKGRPAKYGKIPAMDCTYTTTAKILRQKPDPRGLRKLGLLAAALAMFGLLPRRLASR